MINEEPIYSKWNVKNSLLNRGSLCSKCSVGSALTEQFTNINEEGLDDVSKKPNCEQWNCRNKSFYLCDPHPCSSIVRCMFIKSECCRLIHPAVKETPGTWRQVLFSRNSKGVSLGRKYKKGGWLGRVSGYYSTSQLPAPESEQ